MCRPGFSPTVTQDFLLEMLACASIGGIFRRASDWDGIFKGMAALPCVRRQEPSTTFRLRATCSGLVMHRHGIQSLSGITWILKTHGQVIPEEIHSQCHMEGLLA